MQIFAVLSIDAAGGSISATSPIAINAAIAPARQKSMCWHDTWLDCGRPHSLGVIANIIHCTCNAYLCAIRFDRKMKRLRRFVKL